MYSSETQGEFINRVRQRYQRRAAFGSHTVLFGFFALCSSIYILAPDIWGRFMTLPNIGDLFLILVIWAAFFATHAVHFYFQEAGDRAIEREMAQFGKAKRRLSSDLIEDDIDWDEEDNQQYRGVTR